MFSKVGPPAGMVFSLVSHARDLVSVHGLDHPIWMPSMIGQTEPSGEFSQYDH